MYSEVAWVLLPLGAQVQPQIILEPGYRPDCFSVSYGYDEKLLIILSKSVILDFCASD